MEKCTIKFPPLSSADVCIKVIKLLNTLNSMNTQIAVNILNQKELGLTVNNNNVISIVYKKKVNGKCGNDTACTNGRTLWISNRTTLPYGEFSKEVGHFNRPDWVSHYAQMILHEYGHLTQGHPYSLPVDKKEKETEADCWAKQFITKADIQIKMLK